MINKDIIRLASNTSNVGLKNKYSHKISLKNTICGDKITLEIDDKTLSRLCLNIYNIEYSKQDEQTTSTDLDTKDQVTVNQTEDCMDVLDNKL